MNRHKNISKECLNGSLVTDDIQTNIQRTDHFLTSFPGQPGKTHGAMPIADWCHESTIPVRGKAEEAAPHCRGYINQYLC